MTIEKYRTRNSGLLPSERGMVSGKTGPETGEWDTITRYNGESIWDAESGGFSEAVHRMGRKKFMESRRGKLSAWTGKPCEGAVEKVKNPFIW